MKWYEAQSFYYKQLLRLGMIGICWVQFVSADHVDFDSLYPKSWYTKATENCVHVWGSLDQLRHQSPKQSQSFIERAIGQLVFAQSCFDRVKHDQVPPSPEHLYYLSRVIGTIADHAQHMDCDDDRMDCLKERVEKMKKRLMHYFPQDQSLSTVTQ